MKLVLRGQFRIRPLAAGRLKSDLGLEIGREPSARLHAGSSFPSEDPHYAPVSKAGTTSGMTGYHAIGIGGVGFAVVAMEVTEQSKPHSELITFRNHGRFEPFLGRLWGRHFGDEKMKNTFMLTAAAALLASIAVPSIAQDAGAGVSVDTPAGQMDADADVNADSNADVNADATADQTYGAVMSSVAGSADVDLSAVTDEAKVTIVLLSSLQGNADTEAAALDEELTANADAMTKLHSNIEANATIKAKLEAEGHTSNDVVAVKSNADGSVVVYVDDRA